MTFGSGDFTYRLDEDWGRLPEGWSFGWIPAIAVDSDDRVFVYSRSEHPLVCFDLEGTFIEAWGDGVLEDAHGLGFDQNGRLICTEWEGHCLRAFTPEGELDWTLGTPGSEGATGEPFRRPTDADVDASGNLYVSDGYTNTRVHKFSPSREHLLSWGEAGTGPGQFDLPHCVRVDRHDRVWVADRANNRIQIFDTQGNYMSEWTGLHGPDTIHFGSDDIVYIAELDQRVSIWTMDGQKLSEWGDGVRQDQPGLFKGCPHGIWTDRNGDLYVSEVQTDARVQKYIRQ